MYGGAPSGGIGIGGSSSGGRTWPSTTSVSSSGKRIQKEMTELSIEAPPDCAAGPKGDNLYHWVATLFGPPGQSSIPLSLFSYKELIFLFLVDQYYKVLIFFF